MNSIFIEQLFRVKRVIMKKNILLSFIGWIIIFSGIEASTLGQFSFYLFEQGHPKSQVILTIDGRKIGKSTKDGTLVGRIKPGFHQFQFIPKGHQKTAFLFERSIVEGEVLQGIITFFQDGQAPVLELESSNKQLKAPTTTQHKKSTSQLVGTIAGTVISAETQKPVKEAQVYLSGLDKKIRTDKAGQFSIHKIPIGNYSLSILHPAFNSYTRESLQVSSDKATSLAIKLTPVGVDLPEFVVLEPHISGSLASIMAEQRNTSAVANILGSEQIAKAGDSSVAMALKRTSGLTLVDGKFIFIRGLGERYSSTLVNGISIPSPDPTRRVVPLNLFPTSFIDSVLVQKSYAAHLPGEFAGGTIELRTRDIPDDFFFNVTGKISMSEGNNFSNGLRYQGSNTDFLGIDDGTRKLPNSISSAISDGNVLTPLTRFNPTGISSQKFEQFGEDLSKIWDISSRSLPPDYRLEGALGDRFEYGDFSFGAMAAARWNQSWNIQNEIRREFAFSSNDLQLTKDFDVNRTLRNVQLDGYSAFEMNYTDNHRLFSKFLILRESIDEARIEGGFTDSEVTDIKRFMLKWIENQLFSKQVGGEHLFPQWSNLGINWSFTQSDASRKSPNERHYRYDANDQGDFLYSRKADNNQTIYGNLTDSDTTWRMDVKLPLETKYGFDATLMAGFIDKSKHRNSSIRRFDYTALGHDSRDNTVLGLTSLEAILTPEHIGQNGFQLRESTRSTDNYQATQDLFSYYGELDLNLLDTLRIDGGLRWEDNNQIVETFELFVKSKKPIRSQLKKIDLLPSVAITWEINDQQQLRASWSETISRPDFRELSPAPFTDPVNNRETVGNSDLLQTNITSYDARWEYYFSPKENFSAGFFWKNLDKPIEKVFVPGPGGLLTFQNADAANVYGFELEMLKNLEFIHPSLEYFHIGGNYTWSASLVNLTPENLLAQTTASRPLQGHSSYVINAQIGYENPNWGTTATLLYNTSAKRIVEVGLLGSPDKYSQPFNQLDFIYRQKLTDMFSLNLQFKNLLDDKVRVTQGNKITRTYTKGRYYSVAVSIDF